LLYPLYYLFFIRKKREQQEKNAASKLMELENINLSSSKVNVEPPELLSDDDDDAIDSQYLSNKKVFHTRISF
jgi:hypothetical protein